MRISIFGAFSAGKKCALFTGKYGIPFLTCAISLKESFKGFLLYQGLLNYPFKLFFSTFNYVLVVQFLLSLPVNQ